MAAAALLLSTLRLMVLRDECADAARLRVRKRRNYVMMAFWLGVSLSLLGYSNGSDPFSARRLFRCRARAALVLSC